jgi:hypothetical protein
MNNQNTNNPKKFLHIQITNFSDKLFTIFYLDESSNTIYHTEPSNNLTLCNFNNFPIEWAFSKNNDNSNTSLNPKILPDPSTDIQVIHINFNHKQHSNSNNNNNIIQITSRLLSSRNSHKVFTITSNYMKKFPSLPKNLKKLLTDYQLYLHNQQTSQTQHVNPTSNIHSSSNQISYQQSTTNNTQTNPTSKDGSLKGGART